MCLRPVGAASPPPGRSSAQHVTTQPQTCDGPRRDGNPAGARIDIKSLAARFPEGTTRIAAALRELEAHGYLRRTRERVPDGRIITRTTSCNQPGHSGPDTPRPTVRKRPRHPRGQAPPRRTAPAPPRPRPPPAGHGPPRPAPPRRPPPPPLRDRHRPPRPGRRRLAGVRRLPGRRTARPDDGPPTRAPPPPGGPPGPPPHSPTATPTALRPTAGTPSARPSLPPDLRRLRPRLPRTSIRPLPRLPRQSNRTRIRSSSAASGSTSSRSHTWASDSPHETQLAGARCRTTQKGPHDRSRAGPFEPLRSVDPQASPKTYLLILVTWPAPTVRPPSRMANFRPSSMATGWMSSTFISVLSPGMTISVPSGRVTTPVTSVVRK